MIFGRSWLLLVGVLLRQHAGTSAGQPLLQSWSGRSCALLPHELPQLPQAVTILTGGSHQCPQFCSSTIRLASQYPSCSLPKFWATTFIFADPDFSATSCRQCSLGALLVPLRCAWYLFLRQVVSHLTANPTVWQVNACIMLDYSCLVNDGMIAWRMLHNDKLNS